MCGAQGFPMLSGLHQASYATNSASQNMVLLRCRPLLERAIAMQQAQLQELKITKRSRDGDAGVFRVADMGCSSGPNCVDNMQFMVEAIARYDDNTAIQAFFCDLPSNDFNSLFRQLHHARMIPHMQSGQRDVFSAGVGGSVYGRLFPASSLHLVFSSSCLHWLSQTPESVLKPNTLEWNKGKIWVDGPGANEATGRAYADQWQQDLHKFFKSRSEEMVVGGMMFLLILCRPNAFPSHQMQGESCFRNFELSWQQLLQEGVLDQRDLDTFNIPTYLPTLNEIIYAIDVAPNLQIQNLEVIEEAIGDNYWRQWSDNPSEWAMKADNYYRSGFWNLIEAHVGTTKCEAIFKRFRELLKTSFENLSHWDSYWAYPWSSYAILQAFKHH